LVIAVCFLTLAACSKKEPEIVPEVSVQVAPARMGDVSRIVSAEAVVFPLQQAVVAPKISSTIKSFSVQRGAHVRKGQLLGVLEESRRSRLQAASYQPQKGNFLAQRHN